MSKKRWRVRLAALVLSLIAGSTIGLTPANAGSVDGVGGIPILYAVPANGTTNQAHVCKVIGTDKYANQAVVCVNLTVVVDGGVGSALPYGVVAQAVIELPQSDQNVTLDSTNANDGGNFSSGHNYACYS